jgi:hypothetical protein
MPPEEEEGLLAESLNHARQELAKRSKPIEGGMIKRNNPSNTGRKFI